MGREFFFTVYRQIPMSDDSDTTSNTREELFRLTAFARCAG
jgi:hypothetical protein